MNNDVHISSCNCINKYNEHMSKLFRESVKIPFVISEDGTTKQVVILTEDGKSIIAKVCPFCGLKYAQTTGEKMERENMTTEQKIDYMILTLQLAKSEIELAKEHQITGKGRYPSGTLIRENLKSVARTASIAAGEVVLSPYSKGKIFKDEKEV